jgi:hypothetical protein
MRKLLVATLVVGAVGVMGGEAMAQSTATASGVEANATIIAPIAISNSDALDFGDVVPGTSLGTVVMATAGTRSATGGTTLGSVNVGGAADFTVTGADGYAYSITLPSSITLSDGGVNTMSVDTFTSNPSGTGTLTGGSQALAVGATLHVGANQVAGSYSGSFDVTVTYN